MEAKAQQTQLEKAQAECERNYQKYLLSTAKAPIETISNQMEKAQAECERNYQKYLSSAVKAQSEFEVKKPRKLAKAKLPEKAIKG
jgi:hypothetical protein